MTFEVVRADDPRCAVLEAAGYTVVGESWGARLHDPDPVKLEQVVRRAIGVDVRELGPSYAAALHALEMANEADYPYTPATERTVGTLETIRKLWTTGRVFGALEEDRLVAATTISLVGAGEERRAETGFTSVLAGYRRRGIGQAVKALSILTLYAEGVRVFGTGGAALNEASLGANRALGYAVEERWRSYAPPAD